MSDRIGWLITGLVFIIVIAWLITTTNIDADKLGVCTKAGYDGHTKIKGIPFCYQVTKDGQIEYLRYDVIVSRKEQQ